jgi:hypothetical protein
LLLHITTEEIEKQPPAKRDAILHQMNEEFFQAVDEKENKVLGKDIPIFSEFYQLTSQGVEICNRYMQKLSISPIELKLEGIDF